MRLSDAEARSIWRGIRQSAGLTLTPPAPEACGGRLIPVRVDPDIAAAIVVPDLTRYGDDVLEVVAATHLRRHLRLQDGDVILLRYDAGDLSAR